jgi:hypothetical protein
LKKYDDEMTALNMSESEMEIVCHFFKETGGHAAQDLRWKPNPDDLCIHHDDRIWFDSCSGTGITPEILVRHLRNEEPKTNFDYAQMVECSFHLSCLPSDLMKKAEAILGQNGGLA